MLRTSSTQLLIRRDALLTMSTVPHESLDCQECQEIPQDIQIHPTCIAECLNPFHVADSRTCKEDSTFPSGLFGTEYFQRNFKELVNMFFASRSYGKVSFPLLNKTQEFLHPLRAKVFLEARGVLARLRVRESQRASCRRPIVGVGNFGILLQPHASHAACLPWHLSPHCSPEHPAVVAGSIGLAPS